MRNTLRIVLAGLLLISFASFCAIAAPSVVVGTDATLEDVEALNAGLLEDTSCGTGLSWTLSSGVLTISGSGDMTDWSSVEDTPWYSSISEINSIVVEEGVKSIGNNAFDMPSSGDIDKDFGDLLYEVLDDGVIGTVNWELGDNGTLYLSGTGALSDFASESAVAWKGYRDSIKSVSVAEGITGIGKYAFYGIANLEKIFLPDTVVSLGAYALAECPALTEVYLGGVSSVPAGAFEGSSALETLKCASYECYLGVKESTGNSYDLYVGDCRKVIDLSLPKSVTDIGNGAFDRFYCVVSGYKNTCAESFAESYGFVFDPHDLEIDLGEKQSESNIRYVEIDGFQYELEDDNNKYYVCPEKDMLIEIVEKESADSVYTVSTKYYYVDAEAFTYTLVEGLSSYMSNEKKATIRTKDPVSIRYTSGIATLAKREETDFVIEEYGYIVGVKSLIDKNETQLNFDFASYATGVAYNKKSGIDKIFDSTDDDKCIFTGILINIPKKNYATVVTSKSYTKLTIDGNEFVVYGEPVNTSLYDTAKALVNTEDISPEQNAVLKEIIRVVDGKEAGIPGSDLFS